MPGTAHQSLVHRIRDLALSLRSDPRTDADLLTAFTRGRDEDAFAALVVRHRRAVWDTCRLSLKNDADAEDTFQAVFIALARDAGKVCPGTLEGWLRTVAVRASVNARIAARRRESAHRLLCARSMPAVEDARQDEDLCGIVREELAGLPERLRVAISLYYLEGKTQSEVGRILGVTDRAVAARIRRGLASLRKLLARRGTTVTAASLAVLLGRVAAGVAAGNIPAGLIAAAAAAASSVAAGHLPTTAAGQLAVGLTSSTAASTAKLLGVSLFVLGMGVLGGAMVLAQRPPPIVTDAAPAVPPAPSLPRADRLGDPLPVGAIARIGTQRFRAGRAVGTEDVSFLPDGQTLASVHGGSEVILWEVATGKPVQTFDAPVGVRWVVADPTGRRLAAAGADEVWVWELGLSKPRFVWKWRAGPKPSQPAVPVLNFSPDGTAIAVGDRDGRCTHVLRSDSGTEIDTLPGYPLASSAAAGKYLAVIGGHDRAAWADRLVFWEAGTGKPARTLDARAAELFFDVAQSDDGRAAVRTNGRVRLIDIRTGAESGSWGIRDGARRGLAFLPRGRELVEVEAGLLRFHDPATGAESRPAVAVPTLVLHSLNSNFDVTKQFSPDGRFLATSSYGEIMIWDTTTGQQAKQFGQVHGAVTALAVSPDGRDVLTFAGRSAEVRVWDAASGEPGPAMSAPPGGGLVGMGWGADGRPVTLHGPLNTQRAPCSLLRFDPRTGAPGEQIPLPTDELPYRGPIGQLAPFAVTPTGTRVAVASGSSIEVLDSGGLPIRRLSAQETVAQLVLSADGRTIAAVTHQWMPRAPGSGPQPPRVGVELWDVATGRQRPAPPVANWDFFQVLPAISADGRWLAGVTWDQTVGLVEVSSGRLGQQFECRGRPKAVAFSPDSRLLAAGDTNGTVTAWDLSTGQVTRRFTGHRGPITALAFTPDGRRLVSGSADGTALVWDATGLTARGGPVQSIDELKSILLSADTAAAHRASFALADQPGQAARLLAPELAPPPVPAAADLDRWLRELGDDHFATSEQAETAIEKAGGTIEPALRKRLADGPPPELRLRLERLVARLDARDQSADRVVAVLERVGSPTARRALEDAVRLARPGLKAQIEAALARMAQGAAAH